MSSLLICIFFVNEGSVLYLVLLSFKFTFFIFPAVQFHLEYSFCLEHVERNFCGKTKDLVR